MPTALSSPMSRSLNALISVNKDMEATQNRINSGKSINEASDNIAIYFKARSFTDKADLYANVNASIAQATSNLDFVDKALSNMIDNVKGARQILTDAKAKPVTAATAVSFLGRQTYANTTVTVGAGTRAIRGAIVDQGTGPTANAGIADGSFFQNNDVFRVDIRDSSNNTTTTRFFRAVAPDAAALPDQAKRGDTSANAIEFNDLGTLASALNLGFGRATASFDAVNVSGGVRLSMTLASNSQSITFGQTTDAVQGALGAGDSFDFTKLLQNSATTTAAVTVGNTLDAVNAASAASWTYAPLTGVTTDQTAVDIRRQAADFFRQTIYGLDATTKDASLPGFANLLKGETMTVFLNDTNSVSQTVKLSAAIDFTANNTATNRYGVQFTNNSGTLTTAFTDTGSANNDNFLSDSQLTSAISKLDTISTSLGQQRQLLAAAKTAMSSRLDLNKTMATALRETANAMTAADIAEETTALASLQNRQSFAATSLSISRQSEQQMLALLR